MQKGIAFIGYGEMGKQCYEFIKTSEARFIFFDDNLFAARQSNTFPFSGYEQESFQSCEFVVSLGYHHLQVKKEVIDNLTKLKRTMVSFTHPTSFINPSAEIREGSFIYPMCNIDKEVKIGKGVVVNNSVCISHNTTIHDCCYLSPGVVISGFVEIGECTFIGSGSVISNHVRIGKNVIIGAGSVVASDVPDGASVIGNPARLLPNPLKLN